MLRKICLSDPSTELLIARLPGYGARRVVRFHRPVLFVGVDVRGRARRCVLLVHEPARRRRNDGAHFVRTYVARVHVVASTREKAITLPVAHQQEAVA